MVISDTNLLSSFNKIIVKDSGSSFWKNEAMGGGAKLMDLYPRLFAQERNKNALFKDRWIFNNGFWKEHGNGDPH